MRGLVPLHFERAARFSAALAGADTASAVRGEDDKLTLLSGRIRGISAPLMVERRYSLREVASPESASRTSSICPAGRTLLFCSHGFDLTDRFRTARRSRRPVRGKTLGDTPLPW